MKTVQPSCGGFVAAMVAILAALWLSSDEAPAQAPGQTAQIPTVKVAGTVLKVAPAALEVKDAKTEKTGVVLLSRETRVSVEGKGDETVVAPGKFVELSGLFADGRVVSSNFIVIASSQDRLEPVVTQPDPQNPAARITVRGWVRGSQQDVVRVQVDRAFVDVKVERPVEILVRAADLSLVEPEALVEAEGYLDGGGRLLAKSVSIHLTKTVSAPKDDKSKKSRRGRDTAKAERKRRGRDKLPPEAKNSPKAKTEKAGGAEKGASATDGRKKDAAGGNGGGVRSGASG